jgi:Arc/MetJ-type ribon-helix-helix transcriptional regulator
MVHVVSVRLTATQLQALGQLVRAGKYRSRTAAMVVAVNNLLQVHGLKGRIEEVIRDEEKRARRRRGREAMEAGRPR